MNSRVSRQWFCERYAINADKVHGGGALLARISERFGRLGQYWPVVEKGIVRGGIATLNGLEEETEEGA